LFLKPCRNRAFAFLFADGSNEELSAVQAVEGHAFPHHFSEMKNKVGLAPAAIVSARGSDSSVLKSLDANRPVRSNYPLIGMQLFREFLAFRCVWYSTN
jgi:hypothetical protein